MKIKDLKIGLDYWIIVDYNRSQIKARFAKLNPCSYFGGRLTFKTDNQLVMGDKASLKPSLEKHKSIPIGVEYINCTDIDYLDFIEDVLVKCNCGFNNQFDETKREYNCLDCGVALVSVQF
tara:strand:+ start:267 stop:629 length:363 start_codon:yes stop_codon:yes gene_type:complete